MSMNKKLAVRLTGRQIMDLMELIDAKGLSICPVTPFIARIPVRAGACVVIVED